MTNRFACRFGKWPHWESEPNFILPRHNGDVFLALRNFLSFCPGVVNESPRIIAYLMWVNAFTPYPPEDQEVTAALEALGEEVA